MSNIDNDEIQGFDGRYRTAQSQKPGKTFYTGRSKQQQRQRNPDQWAGYNKAPYVRSFQRHSPLAKELTSTRSGGTLSRKSLRNHSNSRKNKPIRDDGFLEAKTTESILQMSREQLDDDNRGDVGDDYEFQERREEPVRRPAADLTLMELVGDDPEELESVSSAPPDFADVELNPEDEAALELFMPASLRQQTTLADIVRAKVGQFQEDHADEVDPEELVKLKVPKQVIKVYKEVGKVLSQWRSGALPKAFKMIPKLIDWEEILFLTNPEEWTPHVVYQATKMMASQAKDKICQRFYNIILLPRVRSDIAKNRRLNFHLYQAIRKALFKPQAFFRGFLLPLCQDECRGREALIIGGVLVKTSIPVVHSALALYKMTEFPYSGPVIYFMRILINKRYSLPTQAIGALVQYFQSFENDARQMPVVWHQTFLVFAERYKRALKDVQKEKLKGVLKKQFHHEITPLIRRELYSAPTRIDTMDVDI